MADPFSPELNRATVPQYGKLLSLVTNLYSSPWVPIFIILGVAIALRIPSFNESLWYDELWATSIKLGSLYDLGITAVSDVHPPLYLTFMFIWIRFFGDSELSVRLPPLLFGLASIVLTYLLCSRYVGKVAGLIAALLVSISPAHIWYSQEARHYSALVTLVLLSLYAYIKVTNGQGSRGWLITYALASLAMLLTYFFSLAYVAITSFLSLRNRNPQKNGILRVNLAVLVMLAAYIAVKVALSGLRTGAGYLRDFDTFELWILLFNWFPTGNAIWPVSGWGDDFSILVQRPLMLLAHLFLLALLAMGVLYLYLRFRKSAATESWQLVAFFACLPAFMFLLSWTGFRQTYIERSMLTVMPLFYGVLAFGLVSIPYRWGRLSAGAALALLCVIALMSFYRNQSDDWTVYKPNPDWRSTASYLAIDLGKSGPNSIIVAGTSAETLSYYDSRFRRWSPDERDSTEEQPGPIGGGIRSKLRDFARSFRNEVPSGTIPGAEGSNQFSVVYPSHLRHLPATQFPNNQAPGTIYIVHNLHWSDDVNEFKGLVRQYPGVILLEKHTEKGIEVFRFSVGGKRGE